MGLLLKREVVSSLSAYAARLFGIVWRVAIFLLPWQTRWFLEGSSLGGFPWEGGRISVYVSWIPVMLSILLYLFSHLPRRGFRFHRNDRRKIGILLFAAVFFFASIFLSRYLRATLQWWIEAVLLMGFASVTVRAIDRDTVCRWIVYAVLPHAVLGIVQFCTQWVEGSKWVGMATQDPMVPGVSVIESMGKRWLRAYGGFPHPNIFGGWLVVALVSGIEYRVSSIKQGILSLLASIIFSAALVLTFSRSAWGAFGVLIVCGFFLVFRGWLLRRCIDRSVSCLLSVSLIVFAMMLIWQWPLVQTRSSTVTRLEMISVSERRVGFENGMELIRRYPWMGVGPRATAYALVEEGIVPPQMIPILPHNVFVLILDEIGLFGCSLLIFSICIQRRRIASFLQHDSSRFNCLLPVLVIFCLDHYPWSTWSGISWIMLIFCLIFAKKERLDISPDRLAMYGQRN